MTRAPVLFGLAAGLSAATIWWGIAPHDEGLMLQAAARVADGELPYRDFWWNYGPGQPLVLAPFDALLGPSLAPWRVLRVLLDATVALLAWALVRRHAGAGGDRVALLAWLAVAGAMAFPTGPGPNPLALALGLGALLVAPRHVVAAGALAGLAAVVRVEVGAAAALGLVLLGVPRALGVAVACALAGWLPFILAAPRAVADQTLGFLAIQDLQRLALPLDPSGVGADPNKLLELWLPALLLLGTAAWAAWALVRRPAAPALALAPLALAGVAYLLGRTDEFHLVPLAVVLPAGLAVAAAREPRRPVALALAGVVALVALHGLGRQAGRLLHVPPLAPVPGPAGDGVRTEAAEARDLRGVLRAVGGRSLFVAPPRFDQVTVGHPLLYVLAGRDNPTRYDVMQPGVVTTAAVQREMVGDLRRARPAVLVRWRDPRTAPEPNAGGRSSGVGLLDRHLADAYGRSRRYGMFEVLERVGG